MIDRRPGATLRSLGAATIVVVCRRGNGPVPDTGAADTIAVVPGLPGSSGELPGEPVDGGFVLRNVEVTILCARGVGQGRLCL